MKNVNDRYSFIVRFDDGETWGYYESRKLVPKREHNYGSLHYFLFLGFYSKEELKKLFPSISKREFSDKRINSFLKEKLDELRNTFFAGKEKSNFIDEETGEIDFKETELKFYKNYIIGDPSFLVDEKYVDLTFLTIPPNIKTI